MNPDTVYKGSKNLLFAISRSGSTTETVKAVEQFKKDVSPQKIYACSTRGRRFYSEPVFEPGDAFLFGPETRGLPESVLDEMPSEQILRLPMLEGSRSLNLSNAAAIFVYEAWRQTGFCKGC